MARATRELLITKYRMARTSAGSASSSSGGPTIVVGRKYSKTCAETQMPHAPAAMLNMARIEERWPRRIQLVTISVSSTTIIVAIDGPKTITAASTKASETEKRARIEGTLMLNDPVRTVSPARLSQ